MNTDRIGPLHSVLLPLIITEIFPIGPVWLTGKLGWIEYQANKPSCSKLTACGIMHSSWQSNKKLFTDIGYKLLSYQATFINETIPSSWHFFHTSLLIKRPRYIKFVFSRQHLSQQFVSFFLSFRLFQIVMSFCTGTFCTCQPRCFVCQFVLEILIPTSPN